MLRAHSTSQWEKGSLIGISSTVIFATVLPAHPTHTHSSRGRLCRPHYGSSVLLGSGSGLASRGVYERLFFSPCTCYSPIFLLFLFPLGCHARAGAPALLAPRARSSRKYGRIANR